MNIKPPKLKMLPHKEYMGVNNNDPIRFYYWPIIGNIYRHRVEITLCKCTGGERILEVGFGSGVTFLNLHEKYKEIHGIDLTVRVDVIKAVFDAKKIITFLQNGNVLNMPYVNCFFDTVLLISILEHLKPHELSQAFREIRRVLKPGGQVVYGVPIKRPLMTILFRLLGYDIRKHHYSTEKEVESAARKFFKKGQMNNMNTFFGSVYQVGTFVKETSQT